MLQTIRDKSQGVFAWIILALICITFALFGIQNYLGGGSEEPIATVGDKEFFQQDLNNAYSQLAGSLANMNFDENEIRQQAFRKLIRDEVLLQYTAEIGLRSSDEAARRYISALEYFQTEGEFDKNKYKSLLAGQGMNSAIFVNRIKKALVMEQFQKAVTDTGFSTQTDAERFFEIQNQKRKVDYITIPLATEVQEPTRQEIDQYYQQNQNSFLTEEQVAIEYIELDLNDLAEQVEVDEGQLQAFYQDQIELYTSPERRKISHILLTFDDNKGKGEALKKAQEVRSMLASQSFNDLAKEYSNDTLTSENGGDLGLFNAGVMEKGFDEAVVKLNLGDVSEPVQSSFGYHLIKVTEFVKGDVKPFESVKEELMVNYKKSEAESEFLEIGESLTELSFESPESLQPLSDELGLEIKQSKLFTRDQGEGVADLENVRNIAFSEDVLKGNNSDLVEISPEKVMVMRLLEHQEAQVLTLPEVETQIIARLKTEKARNKTLEKAKAIKRTLTEVGDAAKNNDVQLDSLELNRSSFDLPQPVVKAIFKAAKPTQENPTVLIAPGDDDSLVVVKINEIVEGVMSDSDKQRLGLAKKNIASAFGRTTLSAVVSGLETKANITQMNE